MNTTIKKVKMMIVGTIMLGMAALAFAQQQQTQPQQPRQPRPPLTEVLLKGYTELPEAQRKAENKRFLEMYEGLRVADVRDGMDWFGYIKFGSMDPSVRPMYRSHPDAPQPSFGIARTVRYLPYIGPSPVERGDAYTRWQGAYYGSICTYPWINQIEDGDFMAIDLSGVNAGLCGSENVLRCLMRGNRGFVFNGGGMRDTDEVIMQKIPTWTSFLSQAMVQGRIQFESTQTPVAIGGVVIFPGDIIVADNDGVIVVPRADAEKVAIQAHIMLWDDMATRKRLFEQLGWKFDGTVEVDKNIRRELFKKMGWDTSVLRER